MDLLLLKDVKGDTIEMHDLNEKEQHLLVDKLVISQMVESINHNDCVLEIGPGTGNITRALAKKGAFVTAIEVDQSFDRHLSRLRNVEVIYADVIRSGVPDFSMLVSNLPFHITEPLISLLAEKQFLQAVLLVGGKFVKEATAIPGDSDFGKLSLLVQSFFDLTYLREVEKNCFDPPPRVTAALVRISPAKPKDFLLQVFRELFEQRDKKFKNALREALVRVKGITKNAAREAIDSMALPEDWLSGNLENLSNADLCVLCQKIKSSSDEIRDQDQPRVSHEHNRPICCTDQGADRVN
ncbi:MAG: rRNA adenine N-6-methyltransferase family protein [Patescibacteria group bacterium]|jgi:16S rRNA (adenine1518-N6/adenine1519-N6)-dimethyltransferase